MKSILLLACVFSLMIFINPARALEVSITPPQTETTVNQQGWYTIQIYNDQPFTDDLIITVIGPHLEWLNLGGYYVTLEPYGRRDIKSYFFPTLEGTYQYEILVYSRNNNGNMATQTLSLKVLSEKDMKILELTGKKTGSELKVSLIVSSTEMRNAKIMFDIADSKGNVVKSLELLKEFQSGTNDIEETMSLDKLAAGNYKLSAYIQQYDTEKDITFSIIPFHSVITKREIVSTPFGQQVIITVTNEGNAVEDYSIKDTIQANQYVDFVNIPTTASIEGGDVNYNWKIEGLAVGKSVSIVYNVNRLPFVIGSFVMIFCVVALLGMGVVKVRMPNIRKKHVKKRNEHLIVLEIRGPMTSSLRNVIVRDMISPLGRVLPEFGGPKPVVRQSESGTELIWNLGDIKPRSEIYLSYKIQPLVEAQLKMPRASLSYRTGEDTKMKVFSKQVILEATVSHTSSI